MCGSVVVWTPRRLYNDQLWIVSFAKHNVPSLHDVPLRLSINMGSANIRVQISKKIAKRLINPR